MYRSHPSPTINQLNKLNIPNCIYLFIFWAILLPEVIVISPGILFAVLILGYWLKKLSPTKYPSPWETFMDLVVKFNFYQTKRCMYGEINFEHFLVSV